VGLEREDWRVRERLAQLDRMVSDAARFSAMGVFNVDRSTILGVASTVATYLIIVIQTK